MTLLLLMVFFLCIMAGTATVSISGEFYNPYNSLSIFESDKNANSAGSITLEPYGGYGDRTFSIKLSGSGSSNNGNANTSHSLRLRASGSGKTVVTKSMLREDAAIKPALSETWGYGAVLGSNAAYSASCTLNQMIDIKSVPGYLTFPTASSIHPSTTTGIILDAFDANGRRIFGPKYVPPWKEFGEPRLTLAVWPEAKDYKDVFMNNLLVMNTKW
jgi:hypothetical protein